MFKKLSELHFHRISYFEILFLGNCRFFAMYALIHGFSFTVQTMNVNHVHSRSGRIIDVLWI